MKDSMMGQILRILWDAERSAATIMGRRGYKPLSRRPKAWERMDLWIVTTARVPREHPTPRETAMALDSEALRAARRDVERERDAAKLR